VRAVLLVGFAALSTVAKGVHQVAFASLGEHSRARLQSRLLARLHELPISLFDREKSGRIQSLLSEDAASAARLSFQILSEGLLGLLQLGLVLAVLATRYGRAVLVALALIPIYVAFPLLFSRRTRLAAREGLAATAEVISSLQESIQAVREIRLFGRESWSVERLRRLLAADVSRPVRLSVLRSLYSFQYVVYFLAGSAIYWWGGQLVFAGRLTVGALVALVALLGYLEGPVSRLTHLAGDYQRMMAAAERIGEVAGDERSQPPATGTELVPGGHRVSYEGVSFRYGENAHPLLEEVSFAVEPGERVAIVGPSGAGKSTVVGLLARLYEPQEGCIAIDGRDLRGYSLSSLRREIGFVLQETMLFAGTVRENIRFGDLYSTDEEIEESERMANAHEFIQRLGQGYDTEIGERGVQLSGGQRQRIGIARVLLRKPGILVLDEATSALDTEAERVVLVALERLMTDRTTFVISHRPSAFMSADRILVLDGGRIVAIGRHDELITTCAVYRSVVGGETHSACESALQAVGGDHRRGESP
jgi:ABC-type multidrug transport system fused ATPase/permease subunit